MDYRLGDFYPPAVHGLPWEAGSRAGYAGCIKIRGGFLGSGDHAFMPFQRTVGCICRGSRRNGRSFPVRMEHRAGQILPTVVPNKGATKPSISDRVGRPADGSCDTNRKQSPHPPSHPIKLLASSPPPKAQTAELRFSSAADFVPEPGAGTEFLERRPGAAKIRHQNG